MSLKPTLLLSPAAARKHLALVGGWRGLGGWRGWGGGWGRWAGGGRGQAPLEACSNSSIGRTTLALATALPEAGDRGRQLPLRVAKCAPVSRATAPQDRRRPPKAASNPAMRFSNFNSHAAGVLGIDAEPSVTASVGSIGPPSSRHALISKSASPSGSARSPSRSPPLPVAEKRRKPRLRATLLVGGLLLPSALDQASAIRMRTGRERRDIWRVSDLHADLAIYGDRQQRSGNL